MINFKKAFTPKDVEEIKPGFFIQKKGNIYRQVKPLYWEGRWRLKGQIRWLNIITILILVILYVQGTKIVTFYEQVNSDPEAFCRDLSIEFWGSFGVINENTNTIQFNSVSTPEAYERE